MTNSLKLYSVYNNKQTGSSEYYENCVFIKEGFNIYAFLFGIFWFLYHRLFIYVGIIIIITLTISTLHTQQLLSNFSYVSGSALLAIYFALEAPDAYANSLESKNYKLITRIYAPSMQIAKMQIIEELSKQNKDGESNNNDFSHK